MYLELLKLILTKKANTQINHSEFFQILILALNLKILRDICFIL